MARGRGNDMSERETCESCPMFEAENHVHVQRAAWNDDWIDELLRFDGTGKDHDDQVDNLSAGYHWQMTQYIGVGG